MLNKEIKMTEKTLFYIMLCCAGLGVCLFLVVIGLMGLLQ